VKLNPSSASEKAATTETKREINWMVFVQSGMGFAILVSIFVYATIHRNAEIQRGARHAKGMVLEKHFAPANGAYGLYYIPDGNGDLYPIQLDGSRQDRWIVAVKATDGARGVKVLEVPSSLYFRLQPNQEVQLLITRAGLDDEGAYHVEIDPAALDEPSSRK
jgi:hypothetical protein